VAKWNRKSRRLCINSTWEEFNEQENDAEPLIKSAIRLSYRRAVLELVVDQTRLFIDSDVLSIKAVDDEVIVMSQPVNRSMS
jgi:hypothetical protein